MKILFQTVYRKGQQITATLYRHYPVTLPSTLSVTAQKGDTAASLNAESFDGDNVAFGTSSLSPPTVPLPETIWH